MKPGPAVQRLVNVRALGPAVLGRSLMLHPSYLSSTVKVIDRVSDDSEREDAENDKRNPQPDTDELLHNKEGDCGRAEEDGAPPQVLQGKALVLLQLLQFCFVGHVSVCLVRACRAAHSLFGKSSMLLDVSILTWNRNFHSQQ